VRKTLLYSPEIVSWVRKTLQIIPKIPEGVRKTLGAQNILINTVCPDNTVPHSAALAGHCIVQCVRAVLYRLRAALQLTSVHQDLKQQAVITCCA